MADISKISPDNGTTIYNLKDIEARKRVPEVLLKDTVGWTGKNLAQNHFITNNTAKDSNALFIEGDLKPSTEYILSFETSNVYNFYVNTNLTESPAFINTIAGKNELSFTTKDTISKDNNTQYNTTYGWRILLNGIAQSTNVSLTNIMLRDASISDSTYEPYHESVEEVVGDIRAEQAVLGVKNLFDAINIPENPKTINGATYSINNDEFIIATDAQINSGMYYQQSKLRKWFADKVGIVGILSFEIKADSQCMVKAGPESNFILMNVGTSYQKVNATINDLSQISSIIFYPQDTTSTHTLYVKDIMIRLASDPDDTYAPYVMTNRELTEVVNSGWTSEVEVKNDANCIVYFSENVFLHLAYLRLVGNSTAPTSNIDDETNINNYATERPIIDRYTVPCSNSHQNILEIRWVDNLVKMRRIMMSGVSHSKGLLLYPTIKK